MCILEVNFTKSVILMKPKEEKRKKRDNPLGGVGALDDV